MKKKYPTFPDGPPYSQGVEPCNETCTVKTHFCPVCAIPYRVRYHADGSIQQAPSECPRVRGKLRESR